MEKSLRTLALLALVVFSIPSLFAGTTGKISGTITDATTGEPLFGVNVVVVGTNLGAASDADGQYFIINVPVGIHSVQAQYIGYKTMTFQDVRVSADLTTPLEIALETTILELGESVIVEAQREMVQMDLTSSRRTMTADDIQDMPVATVEGAVGLSAGAVTTGGNLHLRGGRASEVVYLFDGIALNDPLTGNPNDTDIPMMAVDETNVITGGFGAEYGSAQSGVINVVSAEGGSKFHGKLRYTTSNQISDLFANEDPENIHRGEFSISGPLMTPKVAFFASGELGQDYGRFVNQYQGINNFTGRLTIKPNNAIKINFSGLYTHVDQQWGFLNAWSHTILEDRMRSYMPRYMEQYDGMTGRYKDGTLQDDEIPDFYANWLTTDGLQTEDVNGNGVLDDGEDYNGNGVIDVEGILDAWYANGLMDTEDINFNGILDPGEDLNGNGILDSEDADRDSSLTEYNMSDRLPWINRNSSLITGGFTHTLSPKTYYEVKVASYRTAMNSNIIERVNEDRNYNNMLDDGEDLNGNGVLDSYDTDKEVWTIDDDQDMFHDKNNNDYVDESERDWDGDGDIDDLDKENWIHWVDFPVDEGFKHYRDFYGVGPYNPYTFNRDHWHEDEKITTTVKMDFVTQFNVNNKINTGFEYKGYNLYNHDTPDRYGYAEHYRVKPYEFSLYLNDKMEFPGIIVNGGLRWEYFNPKQQFPGDESDPTWTSDDFGDWDGDGDKEYYNSDLSDTYIHELRDLKDPQDSEASFRFAPRLGVSFPITDKDMLYFNYGRYYQRPRLDYLFRNITYNMGGGFPIVGDPSLDPEMTTSYEIGVRHQFTGEVMIEAKGFYKDIFGLTDTRPVYWTVSDWYTTYFNTDYGRVRGFELSLIKRPPSWVYGEVNYTYSIAKGKASSVTQGYLTEWSGNIVPTFESFLDWDQAHTFAGNINFKYQGYLAAFTVTAGSGTRYTRPGQGRLVVENTETLPPTSRTNLRLSYLHDFGPVDASFFMLITNLFNRTNINAVSDIEWYHTYRTLADQHDAGELTDEEYLAQTDSDGDGEVDYNKSHPEMGSDLDPSVYGDKRRFQVGVSFSF